jgi:hypothetical protein
VVEKQRIDIAGHSIIAVLINCDPAHAPAILKDLQDAMRPLDFDIAIELQEDEK